MVGNASSTWAVVIPAYNERGRLKNVLQVVCQAQDFTEIIVVDDGSTDETGLDLQSIPSPDPRLRYIRLASNQGKTAALRTGVYATHCEHILLLDADLLGLKVEHLQALIQPVESEQADMTIGVFRDGKWLTDLSQRVVPWLSGQRALSKDLFYQVPLNGVVGYGIETAFTVIARQRNWRLQYVPLRGAYHWPGEIRRGAFVGLYWKARMYAHIAKAYVLLSKKKRSFPKYPQVWVPLLVGLLLFFLSLAYNNSRASSALHSVDLPQFPIGDVQRLLVIAPHPDDETLGAGGAIQAALAKGMQVRVVVFTNGDGQLAAPLLLQRSIIPRPAAFIRDGEIRQQESLNALKMLGIQAEDVYFLGFPDRQLNQLWLDDWQDQCPLRGDFTHVTEVPYPNAYLPGATYCGSTLFKIISNVLEDYRPDLILLPHLSDDHPDHRAASQFTLLAVAKIAAQDPSYTPSIWGYVVHFGKYPRVRGWHLTNTLLPPISLASSEDVWTRLDLTPDQELLKAQAIQAYSSQMGMLKSFLVSFARKDETYKRVELLKFSLVDTSPFGIKRGNDLELATTNEPVKESTRRMLFSGTDLMELQVRDQDQHLQISAATRGSLIPRLHYQIHFKFPDGTTRTCELTQDGTRLDRSTYACLLNISALQIPAVVGFQAEVDEVVTLDRSGWHFMVIK